MSDAPINPPHPDSIAFADMLAGQLGNRFSELVELMAEVSNVRTLASDRVRFVTVHVPADRPVEITPASIDRARFTILPPAADIRLGDSMGLTLTGLDGVTVAAGIGLTLDTRGRVFALAAAATDIGLCVEQWDAQ